MEPTRLITALTGGIVAAAALAAPMTAAAATTAVPATKVLVFVEENHSLSQMKAGMPYVYSQAVRYGFANQYKATRHPSLPNYLAIAGGSTSGVADDKPPAYHDVAGPSVFGAALTTGRTAKSYQESMPANCFTGNSGRYAVKHNAWAYVSSERSSCLAYDVPSGTTVSGALRNDIVSGMLPNVGQVTPNLDNDAHDGTLGTADAWLKGWLTLIYASPDWQDGRLAVVITADEDAHNEGNTVLTAVLHPSQVGRVVSTPLNHYSLNALLTQVGHAPCIRFGCGAPSMADAFQLTIG